MADDLTGYLAGLVLECEEVPKKDKLKKLRIDVGADEPVEVVTNAGNVGSRTVGYARPRPRPRAPPSVARTPGFSPDGSER